MKQVTRPILAIGMAVIALLMMLTLLARPIRPALAAPPNCTVPGDSVTIQGAIDNPACTSVTVATGVYTENIVITRSLTLQSVNALATTINGGGVGKVISISNTTGVTIEGFTITSGDGSTNGEGGGIAIREATVTIRNNLIEGNVASSDPITRGRGGGIDVISSTVHIVSNTIQANLSYSVTIPVSGKYGVGGGIWIDAASSAIITGNQILSNTAVRTGIPGDIFGGGGGIGGGSSDTSLTIDSNTIRGNIGNEVSGNGNGGGIVLFGVAEATITNNSIMQNTAAVSATFAQGGGIRASTVQTLTVTDNWVVENTALLSGSDGQGGGMYLSSSSSGSGQDLTLTGNWVMSNTSSVTASGSTPFGGPYASGGGIRIWGGDAVADDTLTMQDNHLIGNVSARTMTTSASTGAGHAEGGGLASGRISTTIIISNEVRGNIAIENLSLSGDGSDSWGGRPAGGGMYFDESDIVTLSDNDIRDNVTAQQQAVNEVNAGSEGGGIALINVGAATVSTNTIASNVAVITGSITSNTGRSYFANGGGIRVGCWDKPDCNLSFVGNNILDNVTAYSITMSGSNTDGGAGGGGVELDQSTALFLSNVISGNTSHLGGDGWGGGVNASNSIVTMEGNFILGNRMNVSYNGGSGGVWAWESTLTSTNDIFAHNYDAIGAGDDGTASTLVLINGTLYDNGDTGVTINDSSTAYVTNTIVYSHSTGLASYNFPTATLIEDYNLISNTNNYDNVSVIGTNDITNTDPLFEDVAADDFHLSNGSPAIDKGTSTRAPSIDFEGDTRGTLIDIGADEHSGQSNVYLPIILKVSS